MTQNINLLVSGVRKTAVRYSFATLAKSLGVALVVLFAIHFFLQYQVSALTAQSRSLQEALKDHRGQAEKLTGQAAARKPDAALEAEIAKLEGELSQARESMTAIKGSAFGTQQGFAEYLRAFSRQSLDGLWLTGFSISGAGELELRGRAVRPELVPSYIQRLNGEKALAGRSFARFEMTRPTEPAAEKKAEQPARFLEFSLATKEAVKMTERSQ
jgi:type IV pilus assembly PilN-like protein